MNDEICLEKHKRVDERLDIHETRLNNHSERIDKLEQRGSAVDYQIKNLCEKIDGLITTMKWFIGLLVGSFVAFFFYAVQHNIFK